MVNELRLFKFSCKDRDSIKNEIDRILRLSKSNPNILPILYIERDCGLWSLETLDNNGEWKMIDAGELTNE